MSYALGIELSTQSAKMVVLDAEHGTVIYTGGFTYEREFPKYGTVNGVLPSPDASVRHTSPAMLIEALDRVFSMLKKDGVDCTKIAAIKADAMQHCTVYADASLAQRLRAIDPAHDLVTALSPSLSRKTAPIWEDRSTGTETAFIEQSVKKGVVNVTGNRAELRFPLAQIMKWGRENPAEYAATAHIMLLSAYLTSILCGKISPVDTGDGWGTNLNTVNIGHPDFSGDMIAVADRYINVCGKDSVKRKIGGMAHFDAPAGKINPYFTVKHGVPASAKILVGTGDNPATLLGCGGNIVISLGSSYTVNGIMRRVKPSAAGEYNVFGYTKGTAIALSCFTNGGKLHETFARRYITPDAAANLTSADWDRYRDACGAPLLSVDERLMLPYLMDESVPVRKAGIIREGFSEDSPENIRALHVSQALAMKVHSAHLSDVDEICVVGGGARNVFLRQVISDMFNAKTYTIRNADVAAAFGCAISAARVISGISYEAAFERYLQKDAASALLPTGNEHVVARLIERYSGLEGRA
ncbi:MAG: Hsp70 family protein [Spirochaetes bacterium]|nr:Hsp70 family protein [Spirochaetota bacterium]